jgi:hypothetical protein
MIICPVCGKEYTNSSSLLKHVKLKSRFDSVHQDFWSEFQKFAKNPRDEWSMLTKTDLFREFLRGKGLL